jgi:HlyD family secretion protein
MGALPIVKVRVCITGNGVIRPSIEKTEIRSASTGIVSAVYISEGQQIERNSQLIQLNSKVLDEQIRSLHSECSEFELYIADLELLTGRSKQTPTSARYKSELLEYSDRISYLELAYKRSKKERDRQAGLFRQGLISQQEFDELVFHERQAYSELRNYQSSKELKWEKDQVNFQNRLREVRRRISSLEKERSFYEIRSPVKGSVLEFKGLSPGSILPSGTMICVISPDTTLTAEFYTGSRNLAYLNPGQQVQLHMDAFNPMDWGTLPATISEISDDYLLLNGKPVFRVKCIPETTQLNLKSGFQANIRKGMTFSARCFVCRKSLLKLTMDKMSDWLHPARNMKQSQ